MKVENNEEDVSVSGRSRRAPSISSSSKTTFKMKKLGMKKDSDSRIKFDTASFIDRKEN